MIAVRFIKLWTFRMTKFFVIVSKGCSVSIRVPAASLTYHFTVAETDPQQVWKGIFDLIELECVKKAGHRQTGTYPQQGVQRYLMLDGYNLEQFIVELKKHTHISTEFRQWILTFDTTESILPKQ